MRKKLAIKNRIRRISLYWKTWMITAVTILLTIALFFMIFSIFATRFLEQQQQKKFTHVSDEIFQEIEKKGIKPKKLEEYMLDGYNIFVTQNDEIIYPKYEEMITYSKNSDKAEPIEDDEFVAQVEVVQANAVDSSALSASRKITYQGTQYGVTILSPSIVNQKEIKNVFYSIIPYFIVIGLVVSAILSMFYARYFSKKVNHLNRTIHQMAENSPMIDYQEREGDELQKLENSLHKMYHELQMAMQRLHQEMSMVKRLEQDRQVFMRGATHELKTPIMAMNTMLEGMLSGVEGYENHEYYLQACYQRLQSMSHLVQEMLEVSRIESVMFSGEMNLKEATEEVIEVYDYMIEDRQLTLSVDLSESGKVQIPKRNLQKILSNLIGNAVKYTPINGKITIISSQKYWEIRNEVKDAQILEKEKIFEPFVSLEIEKEEEFAKSHGLGLYIVDTILKQYGYVYHWTISEKTSEFIFQIQLDVQKMDGKIENSKDITTLY